MATTLNLVDREPEQLRDNLAAVSLRISSAATRAGRDPGDIRLLPVTKTHPAQALQTLYDLGHHSMGENRVQELKEKADILGAFDIHWVLIGHLQSNKVNQAARLVHEIQSVDSVKLAEGLSRAYGLHGREASIFLQVNTSGEATKSGFAARDTARALDTIRDLPHLSVRGLMTMAAPSSNPDVPRASFAQLRELRESLGGPTELPELSMGMSGDYEIAIEEGATTVRVGSAIFGARNQ